MRLYFFVNKTNDQHQGYGIRLWVGPLYAHAKSRQRVTSSAGRHLHHDGQPFSTANLRYRHFLLHHGPFPTSSTRTSNVVSQFGPVAWQQIASLRPHHTMKISRSSGNSAQLVPWRGAASGAPLGRRRSVSPCHWLPPAGAQGDQVPFALHCH